MNSDDFEQKLRNQPVRAVPPEWRERILASTQNHSALGRAVHSRRTGGEPSEGDRREQGWRGWFWPCPQAWVGLAAVWVILLALHSSQNRGISADSATVGLQDLEQLRMVAAQRRELARLLELPVDPTPPSSSTPRPRSAIFSIPRG